jgi:hypothetical protein
MTRCSDDVNPSRTKKKEKGKREFQPFALPCHLCFKEMILIMPNKIEKKTLMTE